MLKTLLRVQLQKTLHSMYSKNYGKMGKAGPVLIGLLMVYAYGAVGVMFGLMFDAMYEPFEAVGYLWLYYGVAGVLAFGLSFVFSSFMAASLMYQAKDNELLLSMPIPPWMILVCRVAALWLSNLLTCLLTLLPAGVVHWMHAAPDAGGVLRFALGFFSMPFLCTAMSCLFGYLVSVVTSRMRHKNIATLLFSLLFLAVYFTVYSQASAYVQKLIANSRQIAEAIENGAFPVYHFGVAVARGGVSILYWLLCSVIPFALALWALNRTFMRLCTQTTRVAKRTFDKNKELRVNSPSWALTLKELRRLISSANYTLNACLGALFAIGLPIFLWVKADIVDMVAALGEGIVNPMYVCGIYALALGFSCGMIMVSAPSVSLEGKSYWLTRSLPVKTSDILLAKARAHLVVALPAGLIGSIISCLASKADPFCALGLLLLPAAINLLMAHAGVAINLRHPRLDWTSEAMVVKQGMAVLFDMLLGYAVMLAIALIYIFLLPGQNIGLYMLAWAALLAAGACLVRKYLYRGGSLRYERLG